jgi:hypothetical protein
MTNVVPTPAKKVLVFVAMSAVSHWRMNARVSSNVPNRENYAIQRTFQDMGTAGAPGS